MRARYIFLSIITMLFLNSCEKIFMHPESGNKNIDVFNEYSNICIEKFGLQSVKGIDLVQLRDSIQPFINNDLSDEDLFNYLGIVTVRMQEGHTNLEDIKNGYQASYPFYLGYESAINYTIIEEYYYGENANPNVQVIEPPGSFNSIQYGFLTQDNAIGYIRIESFDIDASDEELEKMMMYLKDAKGIIIDLRGNLGGFVNLAARIASYFTTNEILFAKNYIKNGPEANNFAISDMKLTPSGSIYTFTKKVAILHDRITFSSGSLFSIMLYSLHNVTTLGVKFGGGTGEIIDGFLSNGWKYNLSTSNLVDTEGRPTDNGIEADIPMVINPADTVIDVIIEKAIVELK